MKKLLRSCFRSVVKGFQFVFKIKNPSPTILSAFWPVLRDYLYRLAALLIAIPECIVTYDYG